MIEKLLALICEELGLEESDVNEETVLEDLVEDEFELQELVEKVTENFEVELEATPEMDWSVADLAQAVSDAY